jgi:hypothetical protein
MVVGGNRTSGTFSASVRTVASVGAQTADTQLRTQEIAELREVVEAWPKLSAELRAAVLGMTRTITK